MILRGYIDESYTSENPPEIFGLTCTISAGSEWPWIELAWKNCLEEKNEELIKAGRSPISRYHAVDINNFAEEFRDWTGAEVKEFHKKLVKKVFARHRFEYEGCAVSLRELTQVWPETSSNPLACAYDILLKLLMVEIGRGMKEVLPDWHITLFHERCSYDSTLLNSFNRLIQDPTFSYARSFTTIAPMGWERCIPLQPADMIAYENMKELRRHSGKEVNRKRRKLFSELLSLGSFVPHMKTMEREHIVKLKKLYESSPRERSSKRGGPL